MSQSPENNSDEVELSAENVEKIRTTKSMEIIQIPVRMASETSEPEQSLTPAEEDRTLEQVTDITIDINPEVAEDQKQFTPRASLDDVLDLPSEHEQTAVTDQRKESNATIIPEDEELSVQDTRRRSTKDEIVIIPVTEEEEVPLPSTDLIDVPIQQDDVIEEVSIEKSGFIDLPAEEIRFINVPVDEDSSLVNVPIEVAPYPVETIDVPIEMETAEAVGTEEPEQLETKEETTEALKIPVDYTEEISRKLTEPVFAEPSRLIVITKEAAEDNASTEGKLFKKKSRKEIEEEVQTSLAAEIFDRGSLQVPSRPPSYVTYASWAPPRIHAPAYLPHSALVAPEPKYRNKYTAMYTYTPPAMTRLNQFDDYVKIGPYAQELWSTNRALQRSRSLERRPPPGVRERSILGPSPVGRRAYLGAAYYSAPPTRSSSSSSLMDYVAATRYDLKRNGHRSPSADEGYSSPRRIPSGSDLFGSEILNQTSSFCNKFAAQTENYLRRLHQPYETTTPSYYDKYKGRPYNPYATLPIRQERYCYDNRSTDEWPSSSWSYENRLTTHLNDFYRERESRNRIERDRNYANYVQASPYVQRFSNFTRPYYDSYAGFGIRKSYSLSFKPDFFAHYGSSSSPFIMHRH